MFTGLVEAVGRVGACRAGSGSRRLRIESPIPARELALGESVAVDGACLTVVSARGRGFEVDVVAETLRRTTLGRLRVGSRVHLERALRLGDRLGGHLVQGHVDGTVRLLGRTRRGDDHRIRLDCPAELRRYVATKGSVALAGVSLTVASTSADGFEVALVPHTLTHTHLGATRVGGRLNLEVDLIARYLEGWIGERRIPG